MFASPEEMRLAKRLARGGRLTDGLAWLALTKLGRKAKLNVRHSNHEICIRTDTPDLEVALSCFGGEFNDLIKATPTLRSPLIIDAGGYIGTAAIVLAEAYPEATVVTLEPSSENFQILKANVARYPNIKPLQKALSPTPGVLTLNNRGTGQWGFTLVSKPADREASAIEEVQCTTLGEIMKEFGADGIGILKLDIEGGEHALLSADLDWIPKTEVICIELHDRIVAGCSDLYESAVVGRRNSKLRGEKFLSLAN